MAGHGRPWAGRPWPAMGRPMGRPVGPAHGPGTIFVNAIFANPWFVSKLLIEKPTQRSDTCRNSVQNGMVESFPALMATIFVNFFDLLFVSKLLIEKPIQRLDSHQNSVQNGLVESFPALMATIFVNFFDSYYFENY